MDFADSITRVRSYKLTQPVTTVFAVLALSLSVLSLSIFLLQIWPPRLLLLTEIESASLSVEARLTAETAMRNSILTALGGLVATAVATAALRQASLARKVHQHQKSIDWSKAFAEASKMLSDDNPTTRVSGVIGIRSLAHPNDEHTTHLLASTLASFVRHATQRDADAIQLALQFICANAGTHEYSLADADLTGMDLTAFSFTALALNGASFRGSSIRTSEKTRITHFAGVDLGNVTWKAD